MENGAAKYNWQNLGDKKLVYYKESKQTSLQSIQIGKYETKSGQKLSQK